MTSIENRLNKKPEPRSPKYSLKKLECTTTVQQNTLLVKNRMK
jgi:hypothetical protein